MTAYVADWLNLLIRWAHLIAGIGWIGTSFYFIALDLSLKKPESMKKGGPGPARGGRLSPWRPLRRHDHGGERVRRHHSQPEEDRERAAEGRGAGPGPGRDREAAIRPQHVSHAPR